MIEWPAEGRAEKFVCLFTLDVEWQYIRPHYLLGIMRVHEMEQCEAYNQQYQRKMVKLRVNNKTIQLDFNQYDSSFELSIERGHLPLDYRMCKLCGNVAKLVPNVSSGIFDVHADCFRCCGYTKLHTSKLFVSKLFRELPNMIKKDEFINDAKKFQINVILGVIICLFDAATTDGCVKQRSKVYAEMNNYDNVCVWDPALQVKNVPKNIFIKYYEWIKKTGM